MKYGLVELYGGVKKENDMPILPIMYTKDDVSCQCQFPEQQYFAQTFVDVKVLISYLQKTSALRTQPMMLPRWGTLLT